MDGELNIIKKSHYDETRIKDKHKKQAKPLNNTVKKGQNDDSSRGTHAHAKATMILTLTLIIIITIISKIKTLA